MQDGLEVLRAEFNVQGVARLIERTAMWVSPETFALLPIWFPEHARRAPFYKSNWHFPQQNTNRTTGEKVHKREANIFAAKALDMALGISSNEKTNWSCCHIWGVDDPKFQKTNTIVADNRFYSCVANMVLLPSPLKAFTDSMPEIKAMLRICSYHLYGWRCVHPDVADWNLPTAEHVEFWNAYPKSWPRNADDEWPMGVQPLTSLIREKTVARKFAIARDLKSAGPYYPRDQVLAALEYWNIDLKI